jgi:mono/diheme cytochrome c family protein
MPSLKLSAQEAADIASYLSQAPTPPRAEARPEPAVYRQRCASCHEQAKPSAKPLSALTHTACSEADFQLSGQQQEDIATAFVNSARPSVEQTLAAFNCYACHGPIDPGRDPFFGFSDPAAVALGDEGRIPPPLDGVGRKLTPHWLEKILVHGEGEIRRTMATHMPYFGGANVGHLVEQFAAAHPPTPGVKMDISGHQRHHRAPYGRAEFGTDGVSCVICHGLLGHKSLGVPGPDLTHTAARLRPNWFMEYLRNPAALRPGTRMPALLTTKTDQRIEQLWTYLKEGEQMALPKGLIGGSYALEPEEKPIVFRSFVEGAGTEAIAVGFPGGLNAVFDAHAVGWALVWRGRFLDAESTWIVRRNPPAVPLGDAVKELSILSRDVRFLGYRLDTLGVPTFLYREGAVMVEDRLQPDGQRFCRVLVRDGQRREEVIAW